MNRKLTADQANDVIHRAWAGEPQKRIASNLGVSPATISKIVAGKTWKKLTRPTTKAPDLRGRKLQESDLPIILKRLLSEKPGPIANDYKVSRQTIANIKRGLSWTHIPRPKARPKRRRVWES